jgi:hypothetical protein
MKNNVFAEEIGGLQKTGSENQLEFSLDRCPKHTSLRRTYAPKGARWWFNQMRTAVNRARLPKPPARPEQVFLDLTPSRQS